MALHEPTRSRIYHHFESMMGMEDAAALMDQFPPFDVASVVTTDVLDLRLRETESRLRSEFGELRVEMHTEFGKVRTEMHAEFGDLRTEMHTEFRKVRTEIWDLRHDLVRTAGRLEVRMSAQEERLAAVPGLVIKELVLWLVPVMVAAVGVSAALAKLLG